MEVSRISSREKVIFEGRPFHLWTPVFKSSSFFVETCLLVLLVFFSKLLRVSFAQQYSRHGVFTGVGVPVDMQAPEGSSGGRREGK